MLMEPILFILSQTLSPRKHLLPRGGVAVFIICDFFLLSNAILRVEIFIDPMFMPFFEWNSDCFVHPSHGFFGVGDKVFETKSNQCRGFHLVVVHVVANLVQLLHAFLIIEEFPFVGCVHRSWISSDFNYLQVWSLSADLIYGFFVQLDVDRLQCPDGRSFARLRRHVRIEGHIILDAWLHAVLVTPPDEIFDACELARRKMAKDDLTSLVFQLPVVFITGLARLEQ